jgi:hypothetical protein
MADFATAVASAPRLAPSTTLAWEALVAIGPRQALGRSPLGERFIIPILGGEFKGAVNSDVLQGKVLPGGADRQLWRSDGARELDALYEMQLDDGAVLTIRNRVLIDDPAGGERYAFSHVQVTAPEGPHGWLNRRVFVGTLHPQLPETASVLIRVWMVRG